MPFSWVSSSVVSVPWSQQNTTWNVCLIHLLCLNATRSLKLQTLHCAFSYLGQGHWPVNWFTAKIKENQTKISTDAVLTCCTALELDFLSTLAGRTKSKFRNSENHNAVMTSSDFIAKWAAVLNPAALFSFIAFSLLLSNYFRAQFNFAPV